MTTQPEKEYIITESCIVSAENNLFSFRERKKEWATEIRARLHPHSNTTERDKVLQELFVWVDSEQTIMITTDKIIKKILSLRTPAPEDDFRCKQCGQFSEECECEESSAPEAGLP